MEIKTKNSKNNKNNYGSSSISSSSSLHEILEDMYQRTPYQVTTIESYEMDLLLKGFKSPAHHALYTLYHAFECHHDQHNDFNIQTILAHCHHLLKVDYCFIYNKIQWEKNKSILLDNDDDVVDDDDVGSTSTTTSKSLLFLQPGVLYNVIKKQSYMETIDIQLKQGWYIVETFISTKQIISFIHTSTNNRIQQQRNSSKNNYNNNHNHNHNNQEQQILHQLQNLYKHLFISLATDVREGAVDMALTLSMIPIQNQNECQIIQQIMDVLVHVTALEMKRKQMKQSRRAVEILVSCEKLAAAGCYGYYFQKVLNQAKMSLPQSLHYDTLSDTTKDGLMDLNLWSTRSLLWLFRKGHVLHKVTERDSKDALSLSDLLLKPPQFDDPSLPLVIDIGCGLGVTLIGLAARAKAYKVEELNNNNDDDQIHFHWSKYNYLGSDLSKKAIQWASSLTIRRHLSGRCQFIHASTQTVLEYLDKTKANIKLILLQFPTPYVLQESQGLEKSNEASGCNEKLPLGPNDPSFMANPKILSKMASLVTNASDNNASILDESSYILLQSNCEDVSLYVHNILVGLQLETVSAKSPRLSFDRLELSSRTKKWLEYYSDQGMNIKDDDILVSGHTPSSVTSNIQRAVGVQWSSEPILPIGTETEASCYHQRTPIHRCLFKTKIKH